MIQQEASVHEEHPGWKLSRDCIRDTLIAKRTGVSRLKGLAAKLCAFNLPQLRETSLAPHHETKMTTGRYLQRFQGKKAHMELLNMLFRQRFLMVVQRKCFLKVKRFV